uniref:peptide-methionine (S)-S-oxide reductase n=1 Tax=Macrostomum lignano TaxID=282301 RepID=A0A1I8FDN0_9PLAT
LSWVFVSVSWPSTPQPLLVSLCRASGLAHYVHNSFLSLSVTESSLLCSRPLTTPQVGFAGGFTPNPTYKEVCSGRTGHAEVVRVVVPAAELPLTGLLKAFWESHDPTQGMRQGNDVGTQYRSAIYYSASDSAEAQLVAESARAYSEALVAKAKLPPGGSVTTEIAPLKEFYYAEDEHQQYLHKHPTATADCEARGGLPSAARKIELTVPGLLAGGAGSPQVAPQPLVLFTQRRHLPFDGDEFAKIRVARLPRRCRLLLWRLRQRRRLFLALCGQPQRLNFGLECRVLRSQARFLGARASASRRSESASRSSSRSLAGAASSSSRWQSSSWRCRSASAWLSAVAVARPAGRAEVAARRISGGLALKLVLSGLFFGHSGILGSKSATLVLRPLVLKPLVLKPVVPNSPGAHSAAVSGPPGCVPAAFRLPQPLPPSQRRRSASASAVSASAFCPTRSLQLGHQLVPVAQRRLQLEQSSACFLLPAEYQVRSGLRPESCRQRRHLALVLLRPVAWPPSSSSLLHRSCRKVREGSSRPLLSVLVAASSCSSSRLHRRLQLADSARTNLLSKLQRLQVSPCQSARRCLSGGGLRCWSATAARVRVVAVLHPVKGQLGDEGAEPGTETSGWLRSAKAYMKYAAEAAARAGEKRTRKHFTDAPEVVQAMQENWRLDQLASPGLSQEREEIRKPPAGDRADQERQAATRSEIETWRDSADRDPYQQFRLLASECEYLDRRHGQDRDRIQNTDTDIGAGEQNSRAHDTAVQQSGDKNT